MRGVMLGVLALAALTGFGAEYGLDEQGFITDWILSGPWPSRVIKDVDQGLRTDFLQIEAEAEPYPGLKAQSTFIADWGVLVASVGAANEWGFRTNTTYNASWRELHSQKQRIFFPNRMFGPIQDHFVAYMACYVDAPEAVDAQIQAGSDDDHKIYLNRKMVGKVESSQGVEPGNFKYDVRLEKGLNRILFKLQDRTGDCGFCVQLTDRQGAPLKGVKLLLDPRGKTTIVAAELAAERSPERLRARLASAKARQAAAEKALGAAEAKQKALSNDCAAAEKALAEAYEIREAAYAREHAASAAKGRKSVAEPIPAASCRSSLCLNGRWDCSVDGGKTWRKSYVPCRQLEEYFYKWVFPSERNAAFKDTFDPLNGAEKAIVKTTFDWNGEGAVIFRCDAIHGVDTDFYLNGTIVDSWNGERGIVRIPLTAAKKGVNTLEIHTRRLPHFHNRPGLRGDLFLDFVPTVRVNDVWVKTSWRDSVLGVIAGVYNSGRTPVEAEVEMCAVKDGKVRFRLPAKRVTVPAGRTARVKVRDVWSDPELWNIGSPNLYTLVTDVKVDGKIVDRQEEEFGFREFWICHTDFFLNGKRTFLTGDVGFEDCNDKRRREIVWELTRREGVNLFRVHDSDQWSITAVRDADRMGHAICAQMYPILCEKGDRLAVDKFSPVETWKQMKAHQQNLAAYRRWWRDLRNHPSVLLWSTDNEVVTQSIDRETWAAYNVRNDKIASFYEKYMKELDPDLVLTRDGDIGTWNHQARWYEDPPCDTANYHYPNFNNALYAENWQSTYEYRPVVFGEALYCGYFQNEWVGARPDLVQAKVKQVRTCAPLYTKLGIPCVIYMGPASDCFVTVDETGKGNPWGITASEIAAFKKDGTLPKGRRADQYPDFRIDWPAYSGEGERLPSVRVDAFAQGYYALNIYDSSHPSHVRTAVNDAFKESLRPQPPLDPGRYAEVVVDTAPNADVWTTTPGGNRTGVRADREGRAWFRSLEPGPRTFTAGDRQVQSDVPARGKNALLPGFVNMPHVNLK